MSDGAGDGRLVGKRVWVTRPRERAQELCFLLEDEGAQVVAFPLLELLPPEDPLPLRSAAERISRYAWVILASPSAAHALAEAVREAGTAELLPRPKVAVVGPKTAQTARALGLRVVVQAEKNDGPGLFDALRPHVQASDELLLPVAQDGRRELEGGLRDAGLWVTRVVAYRSEKLSLDPALRDELGASPPDAVVLASPRTAEAFLETFETSGPILLAGTAVAIGPTTAAALDALGVKAAAVAEEPTPQALVEAVVRALADEPTPPR